MLATFTHKDDFPFGVSKISSGNIEIEVYCKSRNNYNSSDTHLAHIYRRIVREKTLLTVFYDGSIKNTKDFINFFERENNELFFVNYNGKEAGFFWLNRFVQKSAFITYCLYKDYWGKKSLEISQDCIKALFNKRDSHGDHLLDVLLGLTPSNNKLALKFLSKINMTIVGKIPGIIWDAKTEKTVDGVLSYRLRANQPESFFSNILMLVK